MAPSGLYARLCHAFLVSIFFYLLFNDFLWQPNNVAKMYQRRLIPPAFGALELENELQYRGLAMRVNSAYDA